MRLCQPSCRAKRPLTDLYSVLRRQELHEALLELSEKKQGDDGKRAAADERLQGLVKVKRLLEIDALERDAAQKRLEAGAEQMSGGEVRQCGGCEKQPAAVFCSNCDVALCASCNDECHKLPFQKRHTRCALAGADGETASDTAADTGAVEAELSKSTVVKLRAELKASRAQHAEALRTAAAEWVRHGTCDM